LETIRSKENSAQNSKPKGSTKGKVLAIIELKANGWRWWEKLYSNYWSDKYIN